MHYLLGIQKLQFESPAQRTLEDVIEETAHKSLGTQGLQSALVGEAWHSKAL